MGKVEKLEREIESLSPEELAAFRAWFTEFDWAVWDAQVDADVRGGKLDVLADQALRDHADGKTARPGRFEALRVPRVLEGLPCSAAGCARGGRSGLRSSEARSAVSVAPLQEGRSLLVGPRRDPPSGSRCGSGRRLGVVLDRDHAEYHRLLG